MKLGIVLLVLGVGLLIVSIPYSLWGIIAGFAQIEEGDLSGGIMAYLGIIGVVAGFVMTSIGAIRVFKR